MAKKTGQKKSTQKKKSAKKKVKAKKVIKSAPLIDDWATTEEALTGHLDEELMDAWLKIREFAADLGPQRIYASGKAVMFSKKVCYFFVRPQKSFLEVVIFLNSGAVLPGFKSVKSVSKLKWAHTFRLVHSDQVEGELTEAISDAYALAPSAL